MDLQLTIHELEARTHVAQKFRFPHFDEMTMYAAAHMLRLLREEQAADDAAAAAAAVAVAEQQQQTDSTAVNGAAKEEQSSSSAIDGSAQGVQQQQPLPATAATATATATAAITNSSSSSISSSSVSSGSREKLCKWEREGLPALIKASQQLVGKLLRYTLYCVALLCIVRCRPVCRCLLAVAVI
jgi:Jumonji helical domain